MSWRKAPLGVGASAGSAASRLYVRSWHCFFTFRGRQERDAASKAERSPRPWEGTLCLPWPLGSISTQYRVQDDDPRAIEVKWKTPAPAAAAAAAAIGTVPGIRL